MNPLHINAQDVAWFVFYMLLVAVYALWTSYLEDKGE